MDRRRGSSDALLGTAGNPWLTVCDLEDEERLEEGRGERGIGHENAKSQITP
jgi:hypothetical protein